MEFNQWQVMRRWTSFIFLLYFLICNDCKYFEILLAFSYFVKIKNGLHFLTGRIRFVLYFKQFFCWTTMNRRLCVFMRNAGNSVDLEIHLSVIISKLRTACASTGRIVWTPFLKDLRQPWRTKRKYAWIMKVKFDISINFHRKRI